MNAPLDESTKRSLEAAAKLVGNVEPIEVMQFIYHLGYMDGLLRMAQAQAVRADKPLRQAP